jgi:hypothetical protein
MAEWSKPRGQNPIPHSKKLEYLIRKLKLDYKNLTHWLIESRIKGIWLEHHKDDLIDKL